MNGDMTGAGFTGCLTGYPAGAAPLQGLEALRTLRMEFPGLWAQLLEWESKTWRNFRKDFSVDELEIRFQFEEERLRKGKDIRSREFHRELKKRLGREEPAFFMPKNREEPDGEGSGN